MGTLESEHIYGIQIRESANDGSDFSNAEADYRIAFLGEDGVWHLKDSAGAVTEPGGSVAEITDIPTADTTTTKVLAPDGTGGVEWRAEAGGGIPVFHGCRIYHNTTQTRSGGEAVTFNTDLQDTDAYHDTGSNPTRITIPTGLGGWYAVSFASRTNTNESVYPRLGGSTVLGHNCGADQGLEMHITWIVPLAEGEYLELVSGAQTLGHVSAFAAQTQLSVALLGS